MTILDRIRGAYYLLRARLATPLSAYGVAGDGITDDTAAMQRALDSQRYVRLPRGNYLLTSDLHIRPDVRIVGDGTPKILRTNEAVRIVLHRTRTSAPWVFKVHVLLGPSRQPKGG